jgi:hypothetical protein
VAHGPEAEGFALLCVVLTTDRVIDGSVGGVLTTAGTVQVMTHFCVIQNFLRHNTQF